LRAKVSHKGKKSGSEEEKHNPSDRFNPGDLPSRAPRLRWSRPKWKPSKEAIRKARLGSRSGGRQSKLPEPREGLKRLGKIRGAILDVLDRAGGTATLQEIADALRMKRPRDLTRRKTTDAGREGLLMWLIEAGIVEFDGEIVSLTDNWVVALNNQRQLGEELKADEVARRRYRIKSEAFHNRRKCTADQAPTEEELHAQAQEWHRRRKAKEEGERSVSPLAAVIHSYLSKSPGDANQKPIWIAATLWALDLYPERVTPRQVSAAIEELGGEQYLRECMERHREGAPPPPTKTVREEAMTSHPPEEPEPPPDPHPLDCECDNCLIPTPRYARPYWGAA
jgi:hypothetical protein